MARKDRKRWLPRITWRYLLDELADNAMGELGAALLCGLGLLLLYVLLVHGR